MPGAGGGRFEPERLQGEAYGPLSAAVLRDLGQKGVDWRQAGGL